MSFDRRFKSALREKIPAETDSYKEIRYSDTIYVHAASHPDGPGAFELYAMVPHDKVDPSLVDRESGTQLPLDVPEAEQFYDDVDRLLEDVTGETYPDLTFVMLEVVDDGSWKRHATVYCTHKLTADSLND